MSIKQHIPNLLTLGNLLCGCLAIVALFSNFFSDCFGDARSMGIIFLLCLSLIFDFLDGMVARALKVSGPIGKELDSLADMVSFGVLPGLMMMEIIGASDFPEAGNVKYLGLLITLMSAYRLAKFNLDDEQSDKFKGVPTPLNAIFIWSIFYLHTNNEFEFISNPYVLIPITLISAFLLVSNFPLLALKFKSLAWKENQAKFVLVICSIILLIVFKFVAIPLILPLYLIISWLHFKLKRL